MLGEESATDKIEEWSEELEESVRRFEEPMTIKQDAINKWKEKKTMDGRKEEENKFARRIEEERKIEEMRQKLQKSIKVSEDQTKEEKVKLPKLVISPFTGTHIDFFRFWNQFETQLDKSDLHYVTKLSYLNEMLVPKVQLLFKGLPYTSEGYERAKTILKSTYGKPSELANAHIQNILKLPVILGSNPVKIHEIL